ncbi:MAG: phosphate acyltransferase PlsX [Pseudomonadaceae bacterium]|nr:phosphate acyltransferase PlsX [Pseudomonadaceae bacterium]
MHLIIDAMGGDLGAAGVVRACHALLAGPDLPAELRLSLVGLPDELAGCELAPQMAIVAAATVVDDNDSLSTALRRKPDSSMNIALARLAAGEGDAMVSAGPTAPLMALARMRLGTIDGISRPAIAKLLPTKSGSAWLLDLGANIDCDASQLLEFGLCGGVLASACSGIAQPSIGLLNIGEEAGKGPDVLAQAAERFVEQFGDGYIGFVEANRLFDGVADVVVCDGLTGNVALKSIEGTASMIAHLLRQTMSQMSLLEKLGLWLLRGSARQLASEIDPDGYNGAFFVGLKHVVVKSHGSTSEKGFTEALRQAIMAVATDVPARCERALTRSD